MMKMIHLQPISFRKSFAVCRPWLAAAIVLLPAGPQARANVREAVKKLLPATVAVEWRSVDTDSARQVQVFRIQKAKAEVVAEAMKDVYRDLLSDPDKSPGGENQQQQGADDDYRSAYAGKTAKGKGRLSIGVDAKSNSVIVSAPGAHFDEIRQQIRNLDKAAKPSAQTVIVEESKKTGSGNVVPSKPREPDHALVIARSHARGVQTRKTPDTVVLASGTVLSSDGLIATLPGVTGEGTYTVTFSDGRELPARLLVEDRRTGLRLLKVDADELPYVELSDEEVELGQQIVAVLSIDATSRAAAQGIVTLKRPRPSGCAHEVYQTDIAAQAMSAGAPLSDVTGKLLGVVAGTIKRDVHQPGSTFGVGASFVKSLLDARDGDETVVIHRPMLGVQIGVSSEKKGAVVERVIPDSAAAAVGIREGDEILAVDGRNVIAPDEVTQHVLRRKPGDETTVVIRRDGEEKELRATLGSHETRSQTAKARYVQRVETVRPRNMYVLSEDGKLQIVTRDENTSRVAEAFKLFDEAFVPRAELSVKPAIIRVQRSDVEKKLDQLNGDVQSLAGQMQKLIEEVGKLRGQLENDSAPEE